MSRSAGTLMLLVAAAALAGCGSSAKPGATTSGQPAATTTTTTVSVPSVARVRVTVVDGNTGVRIEGARVIAGSRPARTNRQGIASIALRRRAALITSITAPGYLSASLRLPFRSRPNPTVRLYQAALQWPMYGVDPQRTQNQSRIHVRPPFRIVWSRATGGLTEFPAVVSQGVAYVSNYSGTVQALSMSDGHVLWSHVTPHGKMASSPAVWGDYLIAHGMDGHVWVLSRADGKLVSQFSVGSPIESSPVVRDGVDYFGAWNGNVYALDLHRLKLRWTYSSGCKITSSASLAGPNLFIGDYCDRLHALALATGLERWHGSVNGRIYGTPAVAGGRIFVPSSTGDSMSAFSTTGTFLWQRDVGSYVYSSPAVWGGRVFFGSYGGAFYALSAANGETLWTVGAGGSISGAAVVVDGIAYAGSFAHRIVGVNARTGHVVLDFPHGEYVPVSGDGSRLLLHGYSRVYAVAQR